MQNLILKNIGKAYFYKIEIKQKKYLYKLAFNKILKNHGAFIDGYINILKYLLSFINNLTLNKEFYFVT